jgi:2-amino-4-hydroxy-6-hydroxymethyldihydropteridine diphosphokinase
MSLFIATGTNIGERNKNLIIAKNILCTQFTLVAESRIYESPAVDFEEQPDFYNQVLEFKTPQISPHECMNILLDIELQMGRNRNIPKGPRLIDLDILFWDNLEIQTKMLQLPHPRLFSRSFVVLPLSELPGFNKLRETFSFTFSFPNSATALILK